MENGNGSSINLLLTQWIIMNGLTSDWMNDVPNFKRVVISNDKKINGKKCKISWKRLRSEPVPKKKHAHN